MIETTMTTYLRLHPRLRNVLHILLLASIYLLLGWVGVKIALVADKVTLFWLPTGVAVAALYRWGFKVWPGVFLGALLINLLTGASFVDNLQIALGNTLSPIVTTWLLHRFQFNPQFLKRRDVPILCGAAMLGMTISATIGSLAIDAYQTSSQILITLKVISIWWMGDTLGVLMGVPLLFALQPSLWQNPRLLWKEFLVWSLISIVTGAWLFPITPLLHAPALMLTFLPFLLVGWGTLRFGLAGGSFGTFWFICAATWATAHGNGPFILQDTHHSLVNLWLFSSALTAFCLMITAVHGEINNMLAHLQVTEKERVNKQLHLEAMLGAVPDLMFELDRQGCYLDIRASNPNLLQHPCDKLLGKTVADMLPADAASICMEAIEEADSKGFSRGHTIILKVDGGQHWFELSVAKIQTTTEAPSRFIVLSRDITDRITAHVEALVSASRFRSLFEQTSKIAVHGYNRKREVIFWNKACEVLFGYTAAEALGKRIEELIVPATMQAEVIRQIDDELNLGQNIPAGDLRLHHANGQPIWVYSSHVILQMLDHEPELYCLDIDQTPQRLALLALENELEERKKIEAALQHSKSQLKHAHQQAKLGGWFCYLDTDDHTVSEEVIQMFDLPETYQHRSMREFIEAFTFPEDRASIDAAIQEAVKKGQGPILESRLVNPKGEVFWGQFQGDFFIQNGRPCLQGTVQDITERKRLEIAMAAAAAESASSPDFFLTLLSALAEAVGASQALIGLIDATNPSLMHTHTYFKNHDIKNNFSYSLEQAACQQTLEQNVYAIQQNAQQLFPDCDFFKTEKIESYIGVALKNSQGQQIGVLVLLNETPMIFSGQIRALISIYAGRIADELGRVRNEEKIYSLAFYDPLTQLPNRRMLLDRLSQTLAANERTQHCGALLFIDLDHFKTLNDTRGHEVGDQLLIAVADRINKSIRHTDTAARLGGDEFVVLYTNLDPNLEKAAKEMEHIGELLRQALSQPYSLNNHMYYSTPSIGINLFDSTAKSVDTVLRHADMAMYQAKNAGRNALRFFDPAMQALVEARALLEDELRRVLPLKNQLVSYYQVQMDHTDQPVGAEVLLRWLHPQRGMISPVEFIPMAEETGLIVQIGRAVLENACEQLKTWSMDPVLKNLSLAVNVSAKQFRQTEFVEEVKAVVMSSGINPNQLKLELTESLVLDNVDESIQKMQALKTIGVGFSMDDFGTGYSSLSYLKRLPLDQLKIDQSFVRDITLDPNDAVIVQTIIAMARSLGLQVIAEGVETLDQKDFLELHGCSTYQGFYFGRPMPIHEFENYCRNHA